MTSRMWVWKSKFWKYRTMWNLGEEWNRFCKARNTSLNGVLPWGHTFLQAKNTTWSRATTRDDHTHVCYIATCKHNGKVGTAWSSIVTWLEYARALARTNKMADRCTSSTSSFEALLILIQSFSALRWSVGLLDQFVTVWKHAKAKHTQTHTHTHNYCYPMPRANYSIYSMCCHTASEQFTVYSYNYWFYLLLFSTSV